MWAAFYCFTLLLTTPPLVIRSVNRVAVLRTDR